MKLEIISGYTEEKDVLPTRETQTSCTKPMLGCDVVLIAGCGTSS
jgi:hypothetical protein